MCFFFFLNLNFIILISTPGCTMKSIKSMKQGCTSCTNTQYPLFCVRDFYKTRSNQNIHLIQYT
jgi:hypothetical protein